MAAGDPWIKRLQEYCHISFNNIIILGREAMFHPWCFTELGVQFSASRLGPSSRSLSLSSLPVFALQAVSILIPCTVILGNLAVQDIMSVRTNVDQVIYQTALSLLFFHPPPRLYSPRTLNQYFTRSLEQPTNNTKNAPQRAPRMPGFTAASRGQRWKQY